MLRLILSNTFFQLLAKFVAAGLTFLTTVLIIRLGGPGLFGDLTKALSLIAIGFTAIDFGLNAEAVRSMRGGVTRERQIFSSVVATRLLLSVLAILVVNLVIYLLPGGFTPEIKSVFWVGSLAILFQGFYTSSNAWFQRRLEYWKMGLSTILGALVGALLTYFSIIYHPSLYSLLLASTTGYFVMAACSLFLLPRLSLSSIVHSPLTIVPTLRRSLPLGLILILSILASKLDTVILGIFRPSVEVGEYGFAYRIFDVALVLPVFVMNSVYPLLVNRSSKAKQLLISRSLFSLLIISLIGMLVFWFVAPLVSLIRPGLELSITTLRLLTLSLPLFYLTAPLMWQLIEARLEKYLLLVYMVAAIFNGITNLIYAPSYGPSASAMITGATEALILTGLLFVRRRYLTNHR